MSSIEQELKKLKIDREESNDALKIGVESYANEIKTYLGEEIKKELLHPTNTVIKTKKTCKFKAWWENLKNRLNNYFFQY